MAKVVKSQQRIVAEPWWEKIKIVYIGAGLGLAWWVFSAILQRYVVEPIACRDISSAQACVDSFGVAGTIAAILVAVLGVYVLIRMIQPRPVLVAVAAAAVLWSLGTYLTGLAWWEGILWSVALYALGYVLFWLVAQIRSAVISIVIAIVAVIAIRLLLLL